MVDLDPYSMAKCAPPTFFLRKGWMRTSPIEISRSEHRDVLTQAVDALVVARERGWRGWVCEEVG